MDLDMLKELLTLLNEQNVLEFKQDALEIKLNPDYVGGGITEIPFLAGDDVGIAE